MNKRLIVSIVLLVIALCVSATSYFLISLEIGKLRNSLYDALYTAESGYDASVQCEQALEVWNDGDFVLRIFTDDLEVAQLQILMNSLTDYAREKDNSLICETCIESIRSLDVIDENNKISLSNILLIEAR